jgi:hypothetical protein
MARHYIAGYYRMKPPDETATAKWRVSCFTPAEVHDSDMVNATNSVLSANPMAFTPTTANAAPSLDSFSQQLSTALQGYFSQLQSGSKIQIDIQEGTSQNPGDSQFTVTVHNLSAASNAAATTTPTAAVTTIPASTIPTAAAPASITPTGTASDVAATGTPTKAIDKSKMTPTDAYWAEQPVAVQALRNCPDDEKFSMAQDLAKQGYAVDLPIMVWGWDPLVTMTLRQQEGYTWIPSAFQPNIPIGPGITNAWNLPSYDAKNPPPGSIKVSTDFANGSNMQDPWIKTFSAS